MYAVIKTGGKQYKVSKDDIISVEKLSEDETAFSEAFEKDYEAKINEAYTPDLQNLEKINELFSEIIQKEAYRTRAQDILSDYISENIKEEQIRMERMTFEGFIAGIANIASLLRYETLCSLLCIIQ